MENLSNRWALVTGASSGFGVQFARLLAGRKANLALVARRSQPMEKLAAELRQQHAVQVVVEPMDLARPGAASELKSRLDARGIPIEILVNNAGYGVYGPCLDQPLEKTAAMLQVNMIAVTELTYLFARGMVDRKSGHVLLIASILGYQPVPGYAAYAASKAYVLQFGEALHQELAPYGVAVTVLSPGMSATSFAEISGQKLSPILKMTLMEPEHVAKAGVEAMLARRASVVPGLFNNTTIFLNRFMPRPLQGKIVGKVVSG